MYDLPVNVQGFSAEGKIAEPDYEPVLVPALDEKLKANKKIRMIYLPGSALR